MRHLHGVAALCFLVACGITGPIPKARPSMEHQPNQTEADQENQQPAIQLRDAQARPQTADETPAPAQTEKLDQAAIERATAAFPPFESEAEQKEFHFRQDSKPPPKTGATVVDVFPPKSESAVQDVSDSKPLEVLRFAPEGAVPLAADINLTFSKAMVPVTSHEVLAAKDVPVRVSPTAPGEWRWLGTRTLTLTGVTRLPMATRYEVTVPAGARAADGSTLAKEHRWNFETPTLEILESAPDENRSQPLQPLIYMAFNQRVAPLNLLSKITLRINEKTFAAVLVDLDNASNEQDRKTLERLAENHPDRWIALRPGEPLPRGAKVDVVLTAGAPSAEGPLTTKADKSFSFRTYGPFNFRESYCSYNNQNCRPGTPMVMRFSNEIDRTAFNREWLTIAPEVPDFNVFVNGDQLTIHGATKGLTRYKVTVSKDLRDVHGQMLDRDVSAEFAVGAALPQFSTAASGFMILDPMGPNGFPVFTVNHKQFKVKVYKVTHADWYAFSFYMRNRYRRNVSADLPGKLVVDKTIDINYKPEEMIQTDIDLSAALDGEYGQAIVWLQPENDGSEAPGQRRQRPVRENITWVQVTDIGLDAFVDNNGMLAWANHLKTGKPLADLELSLYDAGTDNRPTGETVASAKTAQDGTTHFNFDDKNRGGMLLLARSGKDLAILPESVSWWQNVSSWRKMEQGKSVVWHILDDRGMYRPGETVHLKGWAREITRGLDGGPKMFQTGLNQPLTLTLFDARNNEVAAQKVTLSPMGGFHAEFKLPEEINLGRSYVRLEMPGRIDIRYQHFFRVEEFRRPEFEVNVSLDEGPYFAFSDIGASAKAAYYAGGSLPAAPVRWTVTATPGMFRPPNRGDFVFGAWVPWWRGFHPGLENEVETHESITDAAGEHYLSITFGSAARINPRQVTVEASVSDLNQQAWRGSQSMLVHPAAWYVGLRTERYFVEKGKPLDVELIVVDLDGNALKETTVTLTISRLEWREQPDGEWKEVETDSQKVGLKSAENAVSHRFTPEKGGTYRITASIKDPEGRENRTEITRWVSGDALLPRQDRVEKETVTLIPNKEQYQPGDVAEIMVQSPFSPAEGVLTLQREGLVRSERFTMTGTGHTLKIPIEDGHIPNLWVQVDLVGAAPRSGPMENDIKRPAFAGGSLNLKVPPLSKSLKIKAEPDQATLEPGGETSVTVTIQDAQGKPVTNAEAVVIVVDEAVLALAPYQLIDPLETFYPEASANTRDFHSRQNVVLALPENLVAEVEEQTMMRGGGPIADADGGPLTKNRMMAAPMAEKASFAADSAIGAEAQAVTFLSNFDPLAVFLPDGKPDQNGAFKVPVKLPDNLTRYRVMVVAVSGGTLYGTAESTITARQPLMVRPSAPRFLNYGDRFDLPVLLQNQTDQAMTVDVVVRAQNALLPAGGGRRVLVPANDRALVQIPAAVEKAGRARFQVGGFSGEHATASLVDIPVWTPATSEAFAVYGDLDQGGTVQPIETPPGVIRDFGGLELNTSATALQSLTDAVIYLCEYPYQSSAFLASRILAIAALRDVLTAFEAEGLPPAEELTATVQRDIEMLAGMQNNDGGFPFWRHGDESWPYNTVHVAHALTLAQANGFKVPDQVPMQLNNYLRRLEQHFPDYYSERQKLTVMAYGLYVRKLAGEDDPSQAARIFEKYKELPLEVSGWLLSVFHPKSDEVEALVRYLHNRTEETAGTAQFTTAYSDKDYLLLHAERRADGVILGGLMQARPNSDLIPKVVRGLLGHRVKGRWSSTQDNAFVLLSLGRYFQIYEKDTPDFTARAWLDERAAAEQRFQGRTTTGHALSIPMNYLGDAGERHNLVLAKEGPGRLYYRIGMRYAPENLTPDPLDRGFHVNRRYEAVDDPADVKRAEDGSWHVKLGARVKVTVTMVAQSTRYHVALTDHLPAGFEALNPELAVTGDLPPQDDEGPSPVYKRIIWPRPWFHYQNMRDNRVEAFATYLSANVHEYRYVAKATTSGVFVVPPPKAEEMYSPETFGRGAGDRVVIR